MSQLRPKPSSRRRQRKNSASDGFGGNQKIVNIPKPISRKRVFLVWGVLTLGILGLVVRLYKLQIADGEKLLETARRQQTTHLLPYVPRRSIVDSLGNVLAIDKLKYTVFVHPKNFKFPLDLIAQKLAPLLPEKISPADLLAKFSKRQTGLKIAQGLSEEEAKKISQLNFDGVDLDRQYVRFYPQENSTAEVIGYVNTDHLGQAGLEDSQNQLLSRSAPELFVKQTAQGAILPGFLSKKILDFDQLSLQLTIDLRLQRAARAALVQQLKKYNAKRGAIIVMDAQDGSILAMVCEPTFDPNHYSDAKIELFKNWAVSDLYEPGSTFKPINVVIALSQGAIQPETVVFDSGSIEVDGWKILNASRAGNGSINIAQILQVSSNIGMVEIMQRLPKDIFYDRLKKLGLGVKVGIDLPGEAASHLIDKKAFLYNSIEAATAAFGQGFSLTPIKLLQLHGALANGGRLVTPHLIKGLVDPEGKIHWQPTLKTTNLFKPEVTRQVVNMMETVVTQGSGTAAYIPGYRIAGKTGTAQKAKSRGGYIPNAKITSFVAILPVEAPRYVVLVLVDEPQGENTFGSTVAAPVARSVIESLITLKELPPSPDAANFKIKPGKLD
jgi:cell division protein FtsI (penicillin-binding protein 3)